MRSLQFALYIFYYVTYRVQADNDGYIVLGLTISSCEQGEEKVEFTDGMPVFHTGFYQELELYGINLTDKLRVGFSSDRQCNKVSRANLELESGHMGLVTFEAPKSEGGVFSQTRYYTCTKLVNDDWRLISDSAGFYVYESFFTTLPLLLILFMSYSLSSLMSGLNIGLFTLNPQDLEMLKGAGTAKEKKYANKILPVRRSGNFLLCSILMTATFCNSISTVVTNMFLSDWITVIVTTMAIVLLCEILPQSVCTTYPLAMGARTIYITRTCMLLTSPISYPLGKILDCLFGKESALGTYNKDRLKELLAMTHLARNEARIIAGTLKLGNKTVQEIMTTSDDMFKLPLTAVLDFETIATILASGFSRIPIYVGDSNNIQFILLTKDLALLDPEDKVPLRVLVQNVKLKCHYVRVGTTVDKLLEIFKDSRSHMVFVVDERGSTSPYAGSQGEEKKVVGLVTFEDVIEEIFQMEINDETDKYADNRGKRKLDSDYDISKMMRKPSKAERPSPNLRLAIFNFLSALGQFSGAAVSPTVLRAMLDMDIYYAASSQRLPQDTIYFQGKPADYFVMILEGDMEILIGSEGLIFQVGAFQYFGLDALKPKGTFTPDYTLQAVRKAKYLKITKPLYEAALLATEYERTKKVPKLKEATSVYKFFQHFTSQ